MIEETLKRIQTEVIPPGELADLKMQISAEFARVSGLLERILRMKPSAWLEIRQREEIKSDKMADRIWESTAAGLAEVSYKMQMKGIEKVLSAISTRLRIYESEARSHF